MNPFDSCAIDRRCSLHQSARSCVRCSVYLPLLDTADAACAAPPAGTPALLVLDTEQWAARRLLEAHQSVSALQAVLSVVTKYAPRSSSHLKPSLTDAVDRHSAQRCGNSASLRLRMQCSAVPVGPSVPLLCGPQHSTSQPAMAVDRSAILWSTALAQYTQRCAALTQRSAAALSTAH
jgi:hypothetical protein